ncbi:peptidase M23 [Leptospira perolatii]|uniref:Peptidase M23 n=1 Tax=Leptospira perolatii TaxID=2023191 RepID=A0A2M9ZN51_9LEPT|nr:peptidase M23 [Leptospira perolatii]PJZ68894.1 peptidase M23 [Leptospira perolatii]PJZ73487.1 peptidase M23 [Leptospira perolatii]
MLFSLRFFVLFLILSPSLSLLTAQTTPKLASLHSVGKKEVKTFASIWKDLPPDLLADLGTLKFPTEVETPISGSYAEFRVHHLHMGCDFKTFQANGLLALSPFEGYVESISQSTKGYGLNVMLKSVRSNLKAKFAHLQDTLGSKREIEYLREALSLLSGGEFSVKLPQNLFRLSKGESFARLGESGTGVSHLHFELHLPGGTLNPLPFLPMRGTDTTPPEILLLYIDSSDGTQLRLPVEKKAEGNFVLGGDQILKLGGELRVRIGAYDLMTSKNKNNLFYTSAHLGENLLFERSFRGMSFEEARTHHAIFDSNRSGLNPPIYVYNLFPEDGPTLDLKSSPIGSTVHLILTASDHAGNISRLDLPIEVIQTDHKKQTITRTEFASSDSLLKIKTSPRTTYGSGKLTFRKLEKLEEDAKLPEGLTLKGHAYELESTDLTWVGEAELTWKGIRLGKKDHVYVFDKGSKRWSALRQRGTISYLTKVGYLAILEDDAKPIIAHPFMITRFRSVPEARDNDWEERLYMISDVGSGYAGGAEVLLEGEPYPTEFDPDRKMLILKIPKSFSRWKTKVMVQIRIKDRAGNTSDWFTDLVRIQN